MARIFKPTQQTQNKDGKMVRKSGPNWYIEYRDHHQKIRRESAGPDETAAGLLLARRLQENALESAGISTEEEPTLSILTKEYITHSQKRVAANTLKSRSGALTRFLASFRADPLPSKLTPKVIGEHLDGLIESGLSNDSANIHLSHIRSMLEWGHASGVLPMASTGASTPPLPAARKKVRPRRALSLEECARLQKAAEGEMKSAILLGLYAGLRIEEICSIEWRDVRFGSAAITIRAEISKNGKEETIPLHQALITYFTMIKKDRRPEPIDKVVDLPKNVYRPLYQLLERVGIDRANEDGVIDWHALRHTYLTISAATGMDVKDLQMLARHANPATTLKVYVHTDTERMRTALNKIPDFSKI